MATEILVSNLLDDLAVTPFSHSAVLNYLEQKLRTYLESFSSSGTQNLNDLCLRN